MKKVLSVVLAFVMVLAVASFAMAATVSYTGSVKAEYNTIDGLNNGYNDTYFTVDYTKDFQNGWSAGAQVKVFAGQTAETADDPSMAVNDDQDMLLESDAVNFTGKGFVKYTTDMWDVAFQTGLDDGIGSAFLFNKLNDKPAVVANFRPMEGLTITGDLAEVDGAVDKHGFDYLVKGVYSLDALTIGGGYSFINGANLDVTNDDATQMGVWGSYKVMDALTVGGEYNSLAPTADGVKAQTAYQVKATYAADPITANLSYTGKSNLFIYNDAFGNVFDPNGDGPFCSAADVFSSYQFSLDENDTFTLISADATYKLTDAVAAVVAVDSLGKEVTLPNYKGENKNASLGYKVAVTDTLAEGLALEAGYKSFIDSKVYVTLTATL